MDERLVAVVGVEDRVLEDGDSDAPQALDVAFDVVGFDGDVFQALALFLEKTIEPGVGIPVLDQVEPALVA